MSIIVGCPKEGVLIADYFVLETPESNNELFGTNRVVYKEKITVTDNGHFAYVYLKEQKINCTEIILQLIYDHESGKEISVSADEVAALIKEPLMVMTKRNFYFIDPSKRPVFNIMYGQISNILINQSTFNIFDLTAEEVFLTGVRNATISATQSMQKVFQSELKLIPLVRKRKGGKK